MKHLKEKNIQIEQIKDKILSVHSSRFVLIDESFDKISGVVIKNLLNESKYSGAFIQTLKRYKLVKNNSNYKNLFAYSSKINDGLTRSQRYRLNKSSNNVLMQFYVDKELRLKFKQKCKLEKISMQEGFNNLLRDFLV